jgi:hypothetical protein
VDLEPISPASGRAGLLCDGARRIAQQRQGQRCRDAKGRRRGAGNRASIPGVSPSKDEAPKP